MVLEGKLIWNKGGKTYELMGHNGLYNLWVSEQQQVDGIFLWHTSWEVGYIMGYIDNMQFNHSWITEKNGKYSNFRTYLVCLLLYRIIELT